VRVLDQFKRQGEQRLFRVGVTLDLSAVSA
jgi:hypothetical protein